MGAQVQIRGLTRHFRGADRPAVDGLDLDLRAGQTLCLVGPSGCGKSTTLRLIAGLDRPDSGSIHIDGADVADVEPQKRDVAMVFQGFALYPHMKVRDILAFPLKMRRMARPERGRIVERTAEMLGLTPLLGRRPGELSGGERQRVAMGRAIVREPRVFLFDEPLSNLDAALRTELRTELGQLLARLEATALYVTHDQSEAMTLGHRIALLSAGRLVQADTPRRIYEKPATTFAARFFGAPPMNLVPVEAPDGEVRFAGAELTAPKSGELVLGIRPEHLRIGEGAAGRTLTATVVGLEPLGAETHVELSAEGARLKVRVEGFSTLAVGDEIRLGLPVDRIRWFDAATGQAL